MNTSKILHKIKILHILIIIISLSINFDPYSCQKLATKSVDRINNIFYPQSLNPVSELNVFYMKQLSEEESFALLTLSGVLSKRSPVIYLRDDTSDEYDQQNIWLKEMQDTFKINIIYDLQGTIGLLNMIKNNIKYLTGIYLYDLKDRKQQQAVSSLCGINNAIAIDITMTHVINELKYLLPIIKDCSHPPISPESIFDEWSNSPKASKKVVIYKDPNIYKILTAYAVFTGAFNFQDKLDSDLTKKVFSFVEPNAGLFGWGAEEDLVSFSSSHSIVVHAADFCMNLNVSTNLEKNYIINMKDKYLSNKNDLNLEKNLKNSFSNINAFKNIKTFFDTQFKRMVNFLKSIFQNKQSNKHTVAFLMTDGDNLQWLQTKFFTSRWFGHPRRGEIPVGWTLSSSIVDILPEIYSYLLRIKSKNDIFVSAPSGEGYTYPNLYPGFPSYAARMKLFLERFGLNSLNILDGNKSPSQEVFNSLSEFTDAIFYYPYGDYAGWKGKIEFVNNTAIIGGRFKLWENEPVDIANKLNNQSNDLSSSDGYSLIPVHVWSEDYGRVLECYDYLDKEKVEVVGVDELIKRILKNINH